MNLFFPKLWHIKTWIRCELTLDNLDMVKIDEIDLNKDITADKSGIYGYDSGIKYHFYRNLLVNFGRKEHKYSAQDQNVNKNHIMKLSKD